jgi:TolB-like protein/DNA-binding winged helix-turn-helix (wHTH) protein
MTDKPTAKNYFFEDFQIDSARKLLLRLPAGETVALTRKAFQVLSLLVENRGRLVTKDDLMSEVWQDSFVEEANLTQTISVLRKILGENPNQHRFIVTETGKGYRFVAQVKELGGGEHEIEKDFVEKTVVESSKKPAANQNYRKPFIFAFALIPAFFLMIGSYYFWNKPEAQILSPSSTKEVKSIAVLPFKNIESDKENQLLGIGMADAVITKLSHVKSIVVRQTKSVMRYADTTPEAIKVGREINVDAVLEGNIQTADGRIRVSVRLFRVSDGALLWAETFDERDTDIFALQDSISEKVAKSLSLELNPDERDKLKRRYTENIEAYQLYNKGRFFWNNRSSEDLRKSIAFYEQAIAKDADYALAYSGLAESYVLLHLFSPNQDREVFAKARKAAEKALSLDENLGEARTALAMYKAQQEWDWEGADLEFKRAVAANPGYATVHQTYGEFLGFMGRTAESIAEVEKAVELDPLSLSTNTARAFPYLAAGKYDAAIEKVKPVLEMDANFPLALYYLGRSYAGKGFYKESIAEYQKAIQNSGGSSFFVSAMIFSLAKDGQKKEAEKKLDELLKLSEGQSISKYVLARGFAALGNKEKALELLEKAYQERDGLMHVIKVDPNFDELRGVPRFQTILKNMRL